jgi:methylmalonyl-CoA mutase
MGHLAISGGYYYSEEDDMADAGKMLTEVKDIPNLRVLAVNSHVFSDTGATIVQELAYGLSMISAYMNALTDQGHAVESIARHMQWNMGIGSDYFMEIAKIRAARMLFSALASSYNNQEAISQSVFIHSITTRWNKTLYDPNVNMLRLTTEAMSASLGGCNSLLVEPFDAVYNEPSDLSERLARNIQIVLKEESYFNRVMDPAAGSYYIESLTNALVEQAWNQFMQIEDQGGYIKAIVSGTIQKDIESTVQRRMEMVASRREILLGTNQFPNVNETINGCIAEETAFPGENGNAEKVANPIIRKRAAMDFEKLRLAVEKRRTPRPRVFMLTYGSLAMRLARSQFSGNFFACGGYEIIDNHGFKSAEEGVNAAFEAKADIIVICSSDDEYTEIAPAVVDLVKDKAIVVVAGAPANMEELKQKGIQEFIHIRSNVLETLKGFHKKLGIEIL